MTEPLTLTPPLSHPHGDNDESRSRWHQPSSSLAAFGLGVLQSLGMTVVVTRSPLRRCSSPASPLNRGSESAAAVFPPNKDDNIRNRSSIVGLHVFPIALLASHNVPVWRCLRFLSLCLFYWLTAALLLLVLLTSCSSHHGFTPDRLLALPSAMISRIIHLSVAVTSTSSGTLANATAAASAPLPGTELHFSLALFSATECYRQPPSPLSNTTDDSPSLPSIDPWLEADVREITILMRRVLRGLRRWLNPPSPRHRYRLLPLIPQPPCRRSKVPSPPALLLYHMVTTALHPQQQQQHQSSFVSSPSSSFHGPALPPPTELQNYASLMLSSLSGSLRGAALHLSTAAAALLPYVIGLTLRLTLWAYLHATHLPAVVIELQALRGEGSSVKLADLLPDRHVAAGGRIATVWRSSTSSPGKEEELRGRTLELMSCLVAGQAIPPAALRRCRRSRWWRGRDAMICGDGDDGSLLLSFWSETWGLILAMMCAPAASLLASAHRLRRAPLGFGVQKHTKRGGGMAPRSPMLHTHHCSPSDEESDGSALPMTRSSVLCVLQSVGEVDSEASGVSSSLRASLSFHIGAIMASLWLSLLEEVLSVQLGYDEPHWPTAQPRALLFLLVLLGLRAFHFAMDVVALLFSYQSHWTRMDDHAAFLIGVGSLASLCRTLLVPYLFHQGWKVVLYYVSAVTAQEARHAAAPEDGDYGRALLASLLFTLTDALWFLWLLLTVTYWHLPPPLPYTSTTDPPGSTVQPTTPHFIRRSRLPFTQYIHFCTSCSLRWKLLLAVFMMVLTRGAAHIHPIDGEV